jgi:hypothetical protein
MVVLGNELEEGPLPVKTADRPAEIRTEQFPTTLLERYYQNYFACYDHQTQNHQINDVWKNVCST